MLKKYFPRPFREIYTNKFVFTVVVLCTVDLVTKYIATSFLVRRHSEDILGEFLRFTLVGNTGGIFGTFRGNLVPSTIVMFFAITLLILMYWRENENLGSPVGWMLVMGGALGNFIDKMFRKVSVNPTNLEAETYWQFGLADDPSSGAWTGVVDFIDVNIPDWLPMLPPRWYIFNVADMYISCGVAILIISMIRLERQRKKEAAAEQAG